MNGKIKPEMTIGATMDTTKNNSYGVGFKNKYSFECYDKDGNLKWSEDVYNIVVNEGLDDILNQYYKGSAYTASHFVGLTSSTPTIAATDTAASHTGWTEVINYSETSRPTLTLGTVASQAVDNSSNKAVFSIDNTATIGGAFIITDSTKGGTTGILVGGAAFSTGDKNVAAGDTLNVTVTLTAATV